MPLEESPETFYQAHPGCRIELRALPVPAGYPLLELETPAGLLRAMDRGVPPAPRGPIEVLLHAVVHRFGPGQGVPELVPLPGGRYRIGGEVRRVLGEGRYCFLGPVPLLLLSEAPLPQGSPLWIESEPPLLAFRP